MPRDIFTVSELNGLVRDVVSCGFPSSLWVCGEIQNLDRYRSKAHLFFELVEKDSGVKDIKAKIGVTIWAGARPKIEAVLRQAENAFELKDGIEVKFSGKVDFYPAYGTLRFIVDDIDPVYTLGKIAQDRQKLIAELLAAGILAKNKQCVLSPLPVRIGLISAFDSAAYNDFMDELKRSGFAFQVFFVNAVMQGKNCETSVCAGLSALKQVEQLDAVVITRGGGSIAELGAFDSKKIALAVAASDVPVITGIGHEINTSVTDLAAHTFTKTPTATAQFLAERVRVSLERLCHRRDELLDKAGSCLEKERLSLKETVLDLRDLTRGFLQAHQEKLAEKIQYLKQRPSRYCTDAHKKITDRAGSLSRILQARFKAAWLKIDSKDDLVRMASPSRIMKRGFSVTRLASGKILRSRHQAESGDELVTELLDGTLTSSVK